MHDLIFISALLGVIILVFIFMIYKKYGPKKKIDRKIFEADQAAYDQKKGEKNQDKTLTMSLQEKIELSWQFLYDITDIVMKKFTKKEREEVHNIGEKLVASGVNYNHVVDLGITPEIVERATKKTKQKTSSGRGK